LRFLQITSYLLSPLHPSSPPFSPPPSQSSLRWFQCGPKKEKIKKKKGQKDKKMGEKKKKNRRGFRKQERGKEKKKSR
jgi:hypothetical protein